MTLSEYFLNLRKDRLSYMESLPKREQLGNKESTKNYLYNQKYVEQEPKEIEAHINRLDGSGLGYASTEELLKFLEQANCKNNYEVRVVNSGDLVLSRIPSIDFLGDSLTKVSSSLYKLNEDNIKNTGLYMDGLSGGSYVKTPKQAGIDGFTGVVEKGTPLGDKEKEALRRNRLRTYWKMQTSSTSNTHRVLRTATLGTSYRDKLNARLKGVSEVKKSNFAMGFGLSPTEYAELMTNDNIPGQEVNPNGGSIYCETNQVAYGSETKKDNIISTGRITFTDRGGDSSSVESYNYLASKFNLPKVKARAILNVSNFFCGPMRTPFYRAQYVNLGNEISTVNTYFDITRTDGTYFNFKFINKPKENRLFTWKDPKGIFGDSSRTSIRALLSRFPDFSENLYNVIILNSDGEERNLMEDKLSHDGFVQYSLAQEAFLSRISSIQLKMPTLKSNSINFLSRTVPMVENSINMGHTGSMSVRLDEGLSIMKALYDWSSLTYRPLELQYPDQSLNKLLRAGDFPDLNIIVHYELISGYMPVSKVDDPSTPYGPDNYIFKQRDPQKGFYSRTFVFEKVRFLGMDSSIDLEKDGGNMDVTIPFTFLRLSEATFGHKTSN